MEQKIKQAMTPVQVFFILSLLLVHTWLLSTNVASFCTDCDGGDVTCVDGVCLPRCVNVTSSGECFQCRESRFYGQQCENICPHTCLNSTCQLNNSRVECKQGCVAGKKGDSCGVDCPKSCTQCERYGDRCVGPCKSPQYYGDYCNKFCPSGCRDGCGKYTGECDNCTRGYRGRYCNDTCPMNCIDGCDRHTGKFCRCKPHFTGEYCESCIAGYRGTNCNQTCPEYCRGECDRYREECDNCSLGYTGKYCNATYKYPSLLSTNGKYQLIIGVALIILLVSAICLFLAIHLWRRRKRRKSPDIVISPCKYSPVNNSSQLAISPCNISTSTPCLRISNPTYMLTGGGEDVHHVKMCDELVGEEAMDQMMAEFYKLPSPDIRPTKHGSLEENFVKNRYRDVLPFDETRVSLDCEDDEENDYINASYINGYMNLTTYVAAQGPSLQAVDDFWRMIWQLKTTKIVMLTNLVEAGKVKCEMYWPNCLDTEHYGKVCVKCVGEEVYEDYTLRTLAVWKGKSETRTVRQFHFTAWPDHGVPEETKSIIDFHRVVKNIGPNASGPMVIHCSAGVGRSGTFLAFDFLMDQAKHEDSVCVYKCVKDMRLQRMKIVQTKIQYKFLHNMLVDALQYSLPRTVHVVCEKCWDKENNSERPEDDLSVEDSHDDYGTLWNSTSQIRESVKLLPDVFVMLNENNPDLFKTAVQIESANIQIDSTNIQIESTNIQKESTNIQKESTNIQKESTNIQKESNNIQTESTSIQI